MTTAMPDREMQIRLAAELAGENFAPGSDGVTARENLTDITINGQYLADSLADGTYTPKPATAFFHAKKNGKERRLVRLSAVDAVVQRAAAEVLRPSFAEKVSEYSFAYISGRGTTAAVSQYICHALVYEKSEKLDPVSCYDNIDRGVLLSALAGFTDNPMLVRLVENLIQTPVVSESGISVDGKGILQGAPLSPMLCNIYFHGLDMLLERSGIPFCRYADDTVVFAKDHEALMCAVKLATDYMTQTLRLRLNTEKFKAGNSVDGEYLGYRFERSDNGRHIIAVSLSEKSSICTDRWVTSGMRSADPVVNIVSDGILSRKDMSLFFETDNGDWHIPVKSTECINIYASVTFAPDVLKLAMNNAVNINIFNAEGKLLGRFVPNSGIGSPQLTLLQLEVYGKAKKRLDYAKKFLLASLHNLRLNIRYYNKQRHNERYDEALEHIDEKELEIKACGDIDTLMLLEAFVRHEYYSCFDLFIKNDEFVYEKRSRRPPRNEVNALLSLGNTVLYNYIATQINKTTLDVRIGFLHATSKRLESLNLDIADIFKPLIVDRVVFTLINKHILTPLHFEHHDDGGVYLNKEGKGIFLTALFDKLDQSVTVGENSKKYAAIITDEVKELAASFRGGKYKGFRQVR